MADRQQKFALFKAQTTQLLSVDEAQAVKGALAAFLSSKDLNALVWSLKPVLSTPEKAVLFSTIGDLIPAKYSDAYAEKTSTKDAQKAGLAALEMLRRQEQELEEYEDEEEEEEEGPDFSANPMLDPTMPDSPFDLAYALAEADLRLDSEHEEMMQAAAAKMDKRKQFKQDVALQRKGFKFQTFRQPPTNVPAVPAQKAAPKRGLPSGAILDEQAIAAANKEWLVEDFVIPCSSRGDAEKKLREGGNMPGLFLVRPKDAMQGSFKVKPGEDLPYKQWVLSFIGPDMECTHNLIVQRVKGCELTIGSHLAEGITDVRRLVRFLRTSPHYHLSNPPFHCQRWYHDAIDRKTAEDRLVKTPVDGRFLVRKSTKEADMWVVCLNFNGKVHHNKIKKREDGAWFAQAAPLVLHRSLIALIEHHCDRANGFQTKLTSSCQKPRDLGSRRLPGPPRA